MLLVGEIGHNTNHVKTKQKGQVINMFEWIEELMEATGCDWETAAREYDAQFNPDYDPEDYDV